MHVIRKLFEILNISYFHISCIIVMICYPLPTSFVLETCFKGRKNEMTCNIYLRDLHFSFYIVIDYRSKAMFQEKKG